MATSKRPSTARRPEPPDHRVATAAKKRDQMRARILEATMHVFADRSIARPVIEDVVREAEVSRGTFYKYFDSLDEAFVAVGKQLSDQFTLDIGPVYDVLKEPWQRFSVGFRIFMLRAHLDHKWAGFVIRMDAWPPESLVAKLMSHDLRLGKELGQFTFEDLDVATDFLMGASAGCIQAIRQGVPDPQSYFNAAVRMGLRALGYSDGKCDAAIRFAERHLAAWPAEGPSTFKPV